MRVVSKFLGSALDDTTSHDNACAIRKLIEIRADGIMTDRPLWVRTVLKSGKQCEHGAAMPEGDSLYDADGRCSSCGSETVAGQ